MSSYPVNLPRETLNNISLIRGFPQYSFPFPLVTLTFCSLNRGIHPRETAGKFPYKSLMRSQTATPKSASSSAISNEKKPALTRASRHTPAMFLCLVTLTFDSLIQKDSWWTMTASSLAIVDASLLRNCVAKTDKQGDKQINAAEDPSHVTTADVGNNNGRENLQRRIQ